VTYARRKTRLARRATISLSDLEQNLGYALAGAEQVIKVDGRCRVHFHSKRHRLADPDGIVGKYILDAFVTAKVLKDDRAAFVSQVSHSQEQIPKDQPEETIVEFWEVKP
jgi:hypothetical protein